MPLQFNPQSSVESIINGIIDENQKGNSREMNGPTIGYLPDGRHLIRWFLDPTAKLFRETRVGRVGKKRFVCPDWMSRTDRTSGVSYPDCELDAISKENDQWRDACRYHCMVYGLLYKTNNQSEYWKVEDGKPTPYLIVGNSKLKQALLDMLGNLREHGMDMLAAMLNPTARGFYSAVSVTKGQQGSISIQVLTNSVDPVDLGEWYVPLSEAFIQNVFDEKSYREAMSEYKANMTPAEGSAEAEAASILEDMDNVEEIAVSSSVDTVPTGTSETTTSLEDMEFPEETVVESTPKAAKSTKKAPAAAKKTVALPENISLAMLPDDCPGWGNYSNDSSTCGLCDFNLECMTTGDAKS